MKKNFKIAIIIIGIAILMAACAKKRPALYPNATYQAAGATVA
jgi:predicted small lipoprotein YifL